MDAIREILPRTAERIAADFAAGQHKGFQVYVSRDGEVVAEAASGEASPDVAMTPNSIVCLLSSGKPLTAMAIGLLWQRGMLNLDDRIARFIPEFAAGGKNDVTIRHLLTHTGGFPNADPGYPERNWDDSIARIAAAPIEEDWEIGRTAGYHPSASWFILGEVISRVTGVIPTVLVCEDIRKPFGLSGIYFLLDAKDPARKSERISWMWRRHGGQLEPLDWHLADPLDERPPRITRASPGSSARGPIGELGYFYEQLLAILAGGDGPVSPQTVEAMTSPHRVGEFDRTFQHTVDFGLGFLVNSNRYGAERVPYGFGLHASPRAFGHGGSQSSIGFADPEHGLVVAWAANAMIGEPRHQKRNRAINTAIYEDLGLDRS